MASSGNRNLFQGFAVSVLPGFMVYCGGQEPERFLSVFRSQPVRGGERGFPACPGREQGMQAETEIITMNLRDREKDGMTHFKELLDLYWTFLKIGCVTFGGGYAMLPILERELVDKRHWTNMDDLRDYFSIGQCTPGIIALNVSTFIGEKRGGIIGAAAATMGFLTGPIFIILVIAAFLTNFATLPVVQHAFAGIRVCVCVLIVQAVLRLWKNSVVDPFTLAMYLIIFGLNTFSGVLPVKVPAAVLVVSAGVIGIVASIVKNRRAGNADSGKA